MTIELSRVPEGGFSSLKDLASRQEIPFKYIESIVPPLVKNGLIESRHGKGGGYRITKDPSEYTIGEILRVTEGDLSPVACLSCGETVCSRKADCPTLGMWMEFKELINSYFDSKKLSDFVINRELF